MEMEEAPRLLLLRDSILEAPTLMSPVITEEVDRLETWVTSSAINKN